MNFSGKVALITGGAQGIGRAYTNALLNIGMKVGVIDILEDKAKEFIESLPANHKDNVIFQKCDVSSLTDFKTAFDRVISEFGRIDILINNAGVVDEQNYMKCIEVNFIAVVNGTYLAFKHMHINEGGHGGYVINTASLAGLEPYFLIPVYVGTKHAIVGFTRSIGAKYHFKKTGIKVNAICPGAVDTELFRSVPSKCCDEEEAKKWSAKLKFVRPEDVAVALIKLLEDDKHGAILRIDNDGLRYVSNSKDIKNDIYSYNKVWRYWSKI